RGKHRAKNKTKRSVSVSPTADWLLGDAYNYQLPAPGRQSREKLLRRGHPPGLLEALLAGDHFLCEKMNR
ncbi:Hypothetical predicted protein, partial [Marmota monax]